MEAVELQEKPSKARQRLSSRFSADTKEAIATVAQRRGSWMIPPQPEDEKEDDHDNVRTTKTTTKKARTVSATISKRASAFTRVFALSSVSETFVEKGLRPTLINAMIFFKDPNPNVRKTSRRLGRTLVVHSTLSLSREI